MKRSLKTSLHHLIRTLTSSLDPNFSKKTYRTVHDSIRPFFSKHCLPSFFLVILQINEKVSSAINPEHTVRVNLLLKWFIEDVQNAIHFRQPIQKCAFSNGPDVCDSKSYSRRTELHHLHAFILVLHERVIQFAPALENICFPLFLTIEE